MSLNGCTIYTLLMDCFFVLSLFFNSTQNVHCLPCNLLYSTNCFYSLLCKFGLVRWKVKINRGIISRNWLVFFSMIQINFTKFCCKTMIFLWKYIYLYFICNVAFPYWKKLPGETPREQWTLLGCKILNQWKNSIERFHPCRLYIFPLTIQLRLQSAYTIRFCNA